MEHDSHSRDHHEQEPGFSGRISDSLDDEDVFEEDEEYDEFDGDDEPRKTWVNLIWAQAHTRGGREGIGLDGRMPWHLSEDLRHFKALTVSHPVIMGRRTWESLGGRPLPNRDNIVVTRDASFRAAGATVVSSPEAAIEVASQSAIPDDGMDHSQIWIIGGAMLFSEMVGEADRAYVTQIDGRFEADTYAPQLSQDEWVVEDETPWMTPEKDVNIPRYRYVVYRRREEEDDD